MHFGVAHGTTAPTWKAKPPWDGPAWSVHGKALESVPSPAMTMMRAARAASASALGRSAWEVDVRAELTADGRVESIVGVDVRWRLSSGPELSAAQLGAWLVAEHGAALGLLAGADVLLPIGTVEWGKGKAQRFQRLRQGTVVAGDAIVALWQQGRVLRGLRAAVTPLPVEESGELDLLQSLADGRAMGLTAPGALCDGPVAAVVRSTATELRLERVRDGVVLRSLPLQAETAWTAYVTTRAMGVPPISEYLCVEAPGAVNCADPGRKAWALDELGARCCKATAQGDDCTPGAVGACVDDVSPAVLAARDALAQVGAALGGVGINGMEANPPGGLQPDLALAPHASVPAQSACDQATLWNHCGPAGGACKGNVDDKNCAIAYHPTTTTGNGITCNSALSNVKGLILLSNQANQQPDVIAHEFGHLWLTGHNLPPAAATLHAGQAATLHEAVSDGLGLIADPQNWLLGEGTSCSGFRSACAPDCKTAAAIAAFTTDPGCVPGPAAAPACTMQPRLFADFAIKPPGASWLSGHFNSGIANFLWFLLGSDHAHDVGGGPAAASDTIAGRGRAALGAILGRWGSLWPAASTPNFDGLGEGLLQIAAIMDPPVQQTVARAVDAAGLWRTDAAASSLWGVGRVAPFVHGDGVGGALVYAVNWDGVRRLNATRCVLGDATCDGMAIRIEDLAWVDADYPAGPPVAVDTASDETFLLYPNHHGELIAQRVAQGSFEAPFGTGAVAPQTLHPGFAVAALANPASGPGLQGDTIVAYVCDQPGCDCGGLRPPNTNVICSQALDGAWHQVLATLAPTEVACSALGVPSGLPPLSTAAPLHQPTLVRSGQHAVLLWVDRHQGAGDYRVLSRVGQPGPGAWQWGAVQPWTTLGAADGSDLGSFTARPIAAAAMPGAGGFSTLAEDNVDRVAVMFQPVRYPDIDPGTGQATCGAVARMYAFASAAVDPANLSLAAFSRSVAQNDGSTALFGAADTYTVPISDDHHAAGGFLAAGDRTYAWLRRATRPCLPPDPPVCVENGPDYAIAPVASYGQLLVKSTGWR